MVAELREALESYQDRQVKNLHVKIKYHDFRQTTIERQLPFTEENFIWLLEERWSQDPRPVRLLGVGVKFEEDPGETSEGQLRLLAD
jgi:DNA polymerase-4